MSVQGEHKRLIGLFLSGQEVPIPEVNLFITQPTIKQIVNLGEDDFLLGISLFSKTDNMLKSIREGNSELEKYSNFQLLMIVLKEDLSFAELINKVCELIFPNYSITFTENSIDFSVLVKDNDGNEIPILVGQIQENNFSKFQMLLKDLFEPQKSDKDDEREFNPANDAAAAIAAKLQKGREIRAKERGPQSLFGIYCSVLSIGMNMDINIFYNYTPFQLYDSFNRFFEKQKQDFYMRVSTMPFMDVSKMDTPEEWTRNLY